MKPDYLSRWKKYQRTRALAEKWRPPVGVTLSLVLWPSEPRVDAVVSGQGQDELVIGLDLDSEGLRDEILGHMARMVMAKAVAAYEAHRVSEADRSAMHGRMLHDAGRTFEDGVELIARKWMEEKKSAPCMGKGGSD